VVLAGLNLKYKGEPEQIGEFLNPRVSPAHNLARRSFNMFVELSKDFPADFWSENRNRKR
jgi:hypothetical protein